MLRAIFAIKFMLLFPHGVWQKCRKLFKDILQIVSYFFMKVGGIKHHGKNKKCGKFHLNPMHGFQENDHHHLQPICIFLEIHDVGLSNFWCEDAL